VPTFAEYVLVVSAAVSTGTRAGVQERAAEKPTQSDRRYVLLDAHWPRRSIATIREVALGSSEGETEATNGGKMFYNNAHFNARVLD
jgi:hypothetical protein